MTWNEFWQSWKPEVKPGSLLLTKNDIIFGYADIPEEEYSDLSVAVIKAGTILLLLSVERTEKYLDHNRRAEIRLTVLHEQKIRYYTTEVVVNKYNGFARNFEVMPTEM